MSRKAVWNEMLEAQFISIPERQFCATTRHSIARYVQKHSKQDDLPPGHARWCIFQVCFVFSLFLIMRVVTLVFLLEQQACSRSP